MNNTEVDIAHNLAYFCVCFTVSLNYRIMWLRFFFSSKAVYFSSNLPGPQQGEQSKVTAIFLDLSPKAWSYNSLQKFRKILCCFEYDQLRQKF